VPLDVSRLGKRSARIAAALFARFPEWTRFAHLQEMAFGYAFWVEVPSPLGDRSLWISTHDGVESDGIPSIGLRRPANVAVEADAEGWERPGRDIRRIYWDRYGVERVDGYVALRDMDRAKVVALAVGEVEALLGEERVIGTWFPAGGAAPRSWAYPRGWDFAGGAGPVVAYRGAVYGRLEVWSWLGTYDRAFQPPPAAREGA
jgi:hypothetical protein